MNLFSGIASVVGTIGSVFIQKAADGKVDVAVAPVACVLTGGLLLACSVQNDEPFSRCVITIGQYIMGAH